MKVGLVTIKESDDFLQYFSGGSLWRDTERSEYFQKGTVTAIGENLIGIGTEFNGTLPLLPEETLDLESQLVNVVFVTDDSNAIITSVEFDIDLPVRFRRIPENKVGALANLIQRKREALNTAFLRLQNSESFDYAKVSEETLKKAQIVFALELFKLPTNKHAENRANGIQSYSISDQSYTYKNGTIKDIPESVYDFVKKEGSRTSGKLFRTGSGETFY
ncbi:hypothetical protein [Leptospira santarosai]|uniref:hypothetical protein n=1 Tax=Leptospira santarosai TaxID=28183 RepID=UPI0024AF57E6|nr:hypothetical protein [Leptospira santarosai]MDI7174849.1 hypothetical protein [Leptospira santarosai]MDI7193792.1 hypothetical protein [Leptospira santarosai]MDO6398901.1 hypothetical protein [Leptospira santarosai]MDO6403631.1 hypothetical protein [Leptospira santarosai]